MVWQYPNGIEKFFIFPNQIPFPNLPTQKQPEKNINKSGFKE